MSVYLDSNPLGSAPFAGKATRDFGIIRRAAAGALCRWQRHRMRLALERLDDRILADIGLYRGDIWHIVNGFDDEELRMVPVMRRS